MKKGTKRKFEVFKALLSATNESIKRHTSSKAFIFYSVGIIVGSASAIGPLLFHGILPWATLCFLILTLLIVAYLYAMIFRMVYKIYVNDQKKELAKLQYKREFYAFKRKIGMPLTSTCNGVRHYGHYRDEEGNIILDCWRDSDDNDTEEMNGSTLQTYNMGKEYEEDLVTLIKAIESVEREERPEPIFQKWYPLKEFEKVLEEKMQIYIEHGAIHPSSSMFDFIPEGLLETIIEEGLFR